MGAAPLDATVARRGGSRVHRSVYTDLRKRLKSADQEAENPATSFNGLAWQHVFGFGAEWQQMRLHRGLPEPLERGFCVSPQPRFAGALRHGRMKAGKKISKTDVTEISELCICGGGYGFTGHILS